MIGRYNKMQTISWDQEVSLCEGISYAIDFFQDFSTLLVDGLVLENAPVNTLLDAIITTPNKHPGDDFQQKNEDWYKFKRDHSIFDEFEAAEKKEKKRAKKWRKKHPKPKNQKEAWRRFKWALEDLGVDLDD